MKLLEEVHRQAIRYPLPKYEGPMCRILSSAAAFNACLKVNLHYFYLRALVGIMKPHRVLDLNFGLSASFMMTMLPMDSKLFCIRGLDSTQASDGDHLDAWDGDPRLIRISADSAGPESLDIDEVGEFDLVFMDDGNMFCTSMERIAKWCPRIGRHGIIAMGDIHSHAGFEWLWKWIALPKFDLGLDIHPRGFGLIMRGDELTLDRSPHFPGYAWRRLRSDPAEGREGLYPIENIRRA